MDEGNKKTSSHPAAGPLKICFLPFLAAGHMIPMVNLARILAARGEHVTMLTTPSNTKHLPPKQVFQVHTLDFPSNELGLPPGIENLSSARDNETAYKICIAANLLIPQIESFLQQNPPHVFVPDFMFTSITPFSNLGITIIPFNPTSIFVTSVCEAINNHPEVLLPSNNSLPFTIPGAGGLPHPITLPVNPSHSFHRIDRPFLQAKHNGRQHGIIVDSFAEFEQEYTDYYQKLTGIKVWHVGISSLMLDYEINNESEHHHHNPRDDGDGDEWLSWLDSKEPNSVVYICFGSLCRLKREQNLEIARGIEASRQGFLWVVPEDNEEFRVPEGFNEEKRGKVVRGWVPQGLILKHPSIGAFFTHCGWNSLTDGICTGVPFITMPRFSDQFLKERLVIEVHGIGVEVRGWEWSVSPYDARSKVVSWELIEKAVRKVMEDGNGDSIRKRAKEMKEKACKAVQQGGSSHHNLTALIQSLKQMNES